SRRRHTRFSRDWSSDVCSSDLLVLTTTLPGSPGDGTPSFVWDLATCMATSFDQVILAPRVPAASACSQDPPFEIVRYPYFPRKFEGLAADAIMPTRRRQPWRLIEAPILLLQMRRRAHRLAASGAFSAALAHWVLP